MLSRSIYVTFAFNARRPTFPLHKKQSRQSEFRYDLSHSTLSGSHVNFKHYHQGITLKLHRYRVHDHIIPFRPARCPIPSSTSQLASALISVLFAGCSGRTRETLFCFTCMHRKDRGLEVLLSLMRLLPRGPRRHFLVLELGSCCDECFL